MISWNFACLWWLEKKKIKHISQMAPGSLMFFLFLEGVVALKGTVALDSQG